MDMGVFCDAGMMGVAGAERLVRDMAEEFGKMVGGG